MTFLNTGTIRSRAVVSSLSPLSLSSLSSRAFLRTKPLELTDPASPAGGAIQPDPELAPHQHTPLEEYDINCIFPVKELKTDKVTVTPFIVSQQTSFPFSFLPFPRSAFVLLLHR